MRLAGRPTLQTIAALLGIFLVQLVVRPFWGLEYVLFLLGPGVTVRPWTLVTSVYAHANLGHLLSNVVALALIGPLVARRTTAFRFHGFFVLTGAVAGLAEVVLGSLIGPPTGVLGASGAVFALLGYLLAGNFVAAGLFRRIQLSRRWQAVLFFAIAIVVTIATGTPRAALIGHAVGLLSGLVAGRLGVLDGDPGRRAA
jgi:membrane associated rhomboid family serine protease